MVRAPHVTVRSDNGVAVIDLKTLEVTGLIKTGRGPNGPGWAVRPDFAPGATPPADGAPRTQRVANGVHPARSQFRS